MQVFAVLTKLKGCESINEFHGNFISRETAQRYINNKENPKEFWIEEDEMNAAHIMCVDKNGWICPFPDDELEDEECINEEEFTAKLIQDIHQQMGIY